MEFYRQCTLRSGTTEMVAWIEEYGAKIGNRVTLKATDDPERLWTVVTVSGARLEHDDVQRNAHRHSKWHEQVDI